MSDIDAVIGLLERWRDATGVGRLRIGVDATRTIAALPPARKRALAAEVAERVAPQLVPAIRAEEGDLSVEQVGAVVDLLRRADEEQLDELVSALRSGDVGGAVDLVDDVVAAVMPAAAPPGPVAPPVAADADGPDVDGPDVASGGDGNGIGDEPGAATVDPGAGAGIVGDEVEVGADGSLVLDEEAVRERLLEEAAARSALWRDSSRDVPTTPAYRAPELDFISGGDLELPDPSVTSVPTLQERTAANASSRRVPGRLAAAPVTAVVAAVTGQPDGYRRRRAALAAIREGRLETRDVAPVVRSLARSTDRSWVAGAAFDAGLVGPGDLDALDLTSGAVARLQRRAAADRT